jgi:hypothetical protein
VKAKRVKAQRNAVALAMKSDRRGLLDAHAKLARGEDLRCVLTRCSPRKLDDDNLASAFKAIRDEVAKQLGVDDGGTRVEWVYKQMPGGPFVLVAINELPLTDDVARIANGSQGGPPQGREVEAVRAVCGREARAGAKH